MCSSSPLKLNARRRRAAFTIDAILERPWTPKNYNASTNSSSSEINQSSCTHSDVHFSPDPQYETALGNNSSQAYVTNLEWKRIDGKLLPFEKFQRSPKYPSVGRSPRVPFTRNQVEGLEAKFRETNYLSSQEVATLANELQVTETRVKIWFQNRRARQRREFCGRETGIPTQQDRPLLPSSLYLMPCAGDPNFKSDLLPTDSSMVSGAFENALRRSSRHGFQRFTTYHQL